MYSEGIDETRRAQRHDEAQSDQEKLFVAKQSPGVMILRVVYERRGHRGFFLISPNCLFVVLDNVSKF